METEEKIKCRYQCTPDHAAQAQIRKAQRCSAVEFLPPNGVWRYIFIFPTY